MKAKHVLVISGLLMLNSCIVKSLNPFYTKDKVVYEKKLEGNWTSKSASWKIKPFKVVWEEHEKDEDSISESDKKAFTYYKDSYVLEYIKNSSQNKIEDAAFSYFVLTAFKVEEHLFINFFPLEYETEGLNNLVTQHILNTHSVCKVDFLEDNSIRLKWLDEDVVNRLIESHNLKIKHEKIGIDEDLVLTASSKELYRFLEKFMSSDIENKWEKDQTYTLIPDYSEE
jgi:hypothetical protein